MRNRGSIEYQQNSLQAWIICLTGTLFFLLESIRVNMYDVLSTTLMHGFNISAFDYGKIPAIYLFINILFLFPAGLLLDRISTKKILITAQIICAVATILFISAHNYGELLFASFIAGVGGTFPFLCATRLARYWFTTSMLGKITSIIVTFAMIGGLIAHVPFLKLSQHIGWRETLAVFFSCEILLLIASFFIIKERNQQHLAMSVQTNWSSIKSVIGNFQNWLAGLYTSFMNLPVTILGAIWGSIYLQQVYHLNAIRASAITSYIFIGMMVGCPLIGVVSDNIQSRKKPMLIGATLTLLISILIINQYFQSLIMISFTFFALGLLSSTQVLGYTVVAESNPLSHTSSAMGIAGMLVMCGGTFLQPLFGKLLQNNWTGEIINGVPQYGDNNFFLAMLILPIAFFIAILLSFPIRETFLHTAVIEHKG